MFEADSHSLQITPLNRQGSLTRLFCTCGILRLHPRRPSLASHLQAHSVHVRTEVGMVESSDALPEIIARVEEEAADVEEDEAVREEPV